MPSTRKYVYFRSYFRLNTRNGTTLLLITCGTVKAWGERGVVALRVRLALAPARLKNAKNNNNNTSSAGYTSDGSNFSF